MIEYSSVFVLGAGAHVSYGFPSGQSLKEACVVCASEGSGDDKSDFAFWRFGETQGVHPQQISGTECDEFIIALSKCGHPSIDAFLNVNRHRKDFQIIGKATIAQVLLSVEQERESTEESKSHAESDDDWLSYLFAEMLDGVSSSDEFGMTSKVGFVTFNYDRFLERWLFERIKHSFTLDNDKAFELLGRIPVHHVYGTLGAFDPNYYVADANWIEAAKNIKTIFDAEHDPVALNTCKDLIANAEKICLLGFGFHQENIQLLELPDRAMPNKKRVLCSRFGLTNEEWKRKTRLFPDDCITSSAEHQKCLQALRTLPIF